jgi:hypothetical protein
MPEAYDTITPFAYRSDNQPGQASLGDERIDVVGYALASTGCGCLGVASTE